MASPVVRIEVGPPRAPTLVSLAVRLSVKPVGEPDAGNRRISVTPPSMYPLAGCYVCSTRAVRDNYIDLDGDKLHSSNSKILNWVGVAGVIEYLDSELV